LFYIYSARTIDEGIEIVMGVPAGDRRRDGTYPKSTISYFVDKRLREMAEQLKGFYTGQKEEVK
jgi:hypothetical protein